MPSLAGLRCVGSTVLHFQNVSGRSHWSRHEFGGTGGVLPAGYNVSKHCRRRRECGWGCCVCVCVRGGGGVLSVCVSMNDPDLPTVTSRPLRVCVCLCVCVCVCE